MHGRACRAPVGRASLSKPHICLCEASPGWTFHAVHQLSRCWDICQRRRDTLPNAACTVLGRGLAADLEADLSRVMKLHQFVQVVSAACRALAALAGLIPKVRAYQLIMLRSPCLN